MSKDAAYWDKWYAEHPAPEQHWGPERPLTAAEQAHYTARGDSFRYAQDHYEAGRHHFSVYSTTTPVLGLPDGTDDPDYS